MPASLTWDAGHESDSDAPLYSKPLTQRSIGPLVASKALPVREGVAPVRDRLVVTFFFATLAHAVLILGLTFSAAADRSAGPPGLQVLLVSDELPESAKNDSAVYLAQRTQKGSGNTDRRVAPRNQASPLALPAQEGAETGARLPAQAGSATPAEDRVLASSGWDPHVRYFTEEASGEASAGQQPMKLDGERAEEAGPEEDPGPAELQGPHRDELWVTPDTRAASLAPYLDAWRHKVERIGTLNYPSAARRSARATSPVLEVAVNSSGTLERAIISQSSGDPELDQASLAILKLASPFDPFPPELERQYRVLHFSYEWQFVGGRVQSGGVSAVP
jgi:periplasmic protein TonB